MFGVYSTISLIARRNMPTRVIEYNYIVSIFKTLIDNNKYEALRKQFPQLPADPLVTLKSNYENLQTNLEKTLHHIDSVIQNPYQFDSGYKAYVFSLKFFLEITLCKQQSISILWPAELKEVLKYLQNNPAVDIDLAYLNKISSTFMMFLYDPIAKLIDAFCLCLAQYFHDTFKKLGIDLPSSITRETVMETLEKNKNAKKLQIEWKLACVPIPGVELEKILLQIFDGYINFYQKIENLAKQVDSLVDNRKVFRISYLTQSLDWGASIYLGFCGHDISRWLNTDAPIGIPSMPLAFPKTDREHHSEMLSQSDRTKIWTLYRSEFVGLFGPATVPFGNRRSQVFEEDIAEQSQSLVTQENVQSVMIHLQAKNLFDVAAAHHVMGLKKNNRGLFFRDINSGVFLIKDVTYFAEWFKNYLRVTGSHNLFNYYYINYKPFQKLYNQPNALYDLARNSFAVMTRVESNSAKLLEVIKDLFKQSITIPASYRGSSFTILTFLIGFSFKMINLFNSLSGESQSSLEQTKEDPVEAEIRRLTDPSDDEILRHRQYVKQLPISEDIQKDIILVLGNTAEEDSIFESENENNKKDSFGTNQSSNPNEAAGQKEAEEVDPSLVFRKILSKFSNPEVKQFLSNNPVANMQQSVITMSRHIFFLCCRLSYAICVSYENKALKQTEEVKTVLFQYPALKNPTCTDLVLEYLALDIDEQASGLNL